MKKNSKRILLLVILITYFILCFINSKNISIEVYKYTLLFVKNVFPSTLTIIFCFLLVKSLKEKIFVFTFFLFLVVFLEEYYF